MTAPSTERRLLNGDEAVAHAARAAHVNLGVGYPGTPSTEILEVFSAIGGRAQWSPNEKVALEVGVGVAFGRGRALVTMKHVGLNVAADPLFTAAYTGVSGALVLAVADDPGMASSQNEQDSRRYAIAAGLPMLEPADPQEAYDFTFRAIELSERWGTPVLLRLTTRVCHSKAIVALTPGPEANRPDFVRDIPARVMIPAYARPAHRRLRERLAAIRDWAETGALNATDGADTALGIITSGVSALHVREAAPHARILKLGLTYPFPAETARAFAASVRRCVVVEEGDPVLEEQCRIAGIPVEGRPERFRFGEMNVGRVRLLLAGESGDEAPPPRGKPPQLCQGCPHRIVFEALRARDCIVSGDIGCYTLGVLPPFEAIDTCVCMGASVGVGLGLRHVLPPEQARRVVSVIGDSTFVHSGLTGLAEMAYNPPATGHVLIILDNGTTAMTGLQEHPGTGRRLDHSDAGVRVDYVALAHSLGIADVHVLDAQRDPPGFGALLDRCLAAGKLSLIIAQRPCLLAAPRIREAAADAAAKTNGGAA